MRRALTILILLCALCVPCAFSQFIPTNEVDGTFDASSYDTGTTGFWGDYFATYWSCMYPDRTNHIYTWSRGGSSWDGDYQNQEEKWCLPLWASFPVAAYNWVQANDNGGWGTTNLVLAAWTNIIAAPPLFFNGTATTNEGAIVTVTITHIATGCVPHDSSDGDGGAIARDLACQQLATEFGFANIHLWARLWTNGWSADVVGGRILGFSTGSHPLAPGGLAIAYQTLLGLNVETNVGSLCFNWVAATVSTNHATATSTSLSGNVLTSTVHFDRMPMAWDAPDGTITNDATGAFAAMPSIGNAFNWIIQVTNLPTGTYEIDVDGHFADRCTSAELASGRNWATNCVRTNPLWLQRAAVLAWKRKQKGEDPTTLNYHSAGNQGALGVGDTVNYQSIASAQYDTNGKRGTNYVTAMAAAIANLQQYDVAMQQASIQTNHTLAFVLTQTATITNLTVGTLQLN